MNNELSVEEVLEQKGVWVSTVQGGSMMPMLRQGQDVIVVEKPPQKINKYDVVLIRKKGP